MHFSIFFFSPLSTVYDGHCVKCSCIFIPSKQFYLHQSENSTLVREIPQLLRIPSKCALKRFPFFLHFFTMFLNYSENYNENQKITSPMHQLDPKFVQKRCKYSCQFCWFTVEKQSVSVENMLTNKIKKCNKKKHTHIIVNQIHFSIPSESNILSFKI